jgi:precorrin-6B methylase 2
MGSLTDIFAKGLRSRLAQLPDSPSIDQMNGLLRSLAVWRQQVLVNTYFQHHGVTVMGGPFAGMQYVERATEGALLPRLIGAYESELHPHLERFAAAGVDTVIDVGCAEGYYAVGLARMLPGATVHARDIDEKALAACADLAARNGVSDRVVLGGKFEPQDFEAFSGPKVLVMVDAEGAEVDVLQPDLAPALKGMNVIVETHDIYRRGALATLMERFADSHDIVRVDTGPKTTPLPAWLNQLGHLDQLLAVWEWRVLPTPWLVMTPKAA